MRAARLASAVLALLLSACGLLGFGDQLTITVRNEMNRPATLLITESLREAPGEPRAIADPIGIGPGEERPVTFASPRTSWSLVVQGQPGYFDSEDLHDWAEQVEKGQLAKFRLVILEDGSAVAETSSN